ncbi:MAG: hypothetical protein ABJL67_12680 [Sulfitobacter sp.]
MSKSLFKLTNYQSGELSIFANPSLGFISDTILGGSAASQIARMKSRALAEIEGDVAEYEELLNDIDAFSTQACPAPDDIAQQVSAELASAAMMADADIANAKTAAEAAHISETVFRALFNLTREPETPDPTMNGMVFVCMTIVEGGALGMFFLSSGFASSFSEAMGIGLSISGANIVMSAGLGGATFGRFWGYGVNARIQDVQVRLKRLMGRIGCVATAGAILVLLLATGIVRATGDAEHLRFDLETIKIAATSFESLMLWIVSGSFSVLAWTKGLSAFRDRYPGFGEACASSRSTREGVPATIDAARDNIQAIADVANEKLSEMAEDVESDRADIAAFVTEAKKEKTALIGKIRTFQTKLSEEKEVYGPLEQLLTRKPADNKDALTKAAALDEGTLISRLPEPELPKHDPFAGFSDALNAAREQVATSYSAALARITEAQSD